MKKWVFISDLIFTFFAAFLPVLCLLRYYRFSLGVGVLIATLFSLFILSIVAAIKTKKDSRLSLRRKEEKEKQLLLYHLALISPADCLSLLEDGDVQTQDGVCFVEKDVLIFTYFSWDIPTADDLLPFLKLCLCKAKGGKLYCRELSPELDGLLAQFSIRSVQGTDAYKQLKDREKLPETYLSEPFFTKKKKRLTRIWFSKKNSRRFLACGGLLLFSSLWVPFPYYYLFFGCAMVVAATLIRVLGYR